MSSEVTRLQEIFSELKSEGFNQEKVAGLIGISQQSISRYLKGERKISKPIAGLFEVKFGYTKDWILEGKLPKKIDRKQELAEVARIAKQGRDLDLVPEIRDLLPDIKKLKEDDYYALVTTIRRFLGKK